MRSKYLQCMGCKLQHLKLKFQQRKFRWGKEWVLQNLPSSKTLLGKDHSSHTCECLMGQGFLRTTCRRSLLNKILKRQINLHSHNICLLGKASSLLFSSFIQWTDCKYPQGSEVCHRKFHSLRNNCQMDSSGRLGIFVGQSFLDQDNSTQIHKIGKILIVSKDCNSLLDT